MGLIGRTIRSYVEDGIREIITEVYTDFNKQSRQILPPGIDSCSLPDDQGVIIELDGTSGKTARIGVYPSASVPAGEIRIYSRDSDGNIVAQLHIKADGKHYFNNGTKSAVSHAELNTALQQLVSDANALYLTAADNGVKGGGLTVDISASEVDEVLLP